MKTLDMWEKSGFKAALNSPVMVLNTLSALHIAKISNLHGTQSSSWTQGATLVAKTLTWNLIYKSILF